MIALVLFVFFPLATVCAIALFIAYSAGPDVVKALVMFMLLAPSVAMGAAMVWFYLVWPIIRAGRWLYRKLA